MSRISDFAKEKIINRYNVDRECYKENGNIRICVHNLHFWHIDLEETTLEREELEAFIKTDIFKQIPFTVKKFLKEKHESLINYNQIILREIEKELNYIEAYTKDLKKIK